MDVVPNLGTETVAEDVTKLKLPEDLSSYIEAMAGRLNDGLSDEDKNKKE